MVQILANAGIHGKLLRWLENYLKGRKQRVVITGKESDLMELKAGVIQGSILGPLLFMSYVNDITREVDGQLRLYVDNATIFISYAKSQRH